MSFAQRADLIEQVAASLAAASPDANTERDDSDDDVAGHRLITIRSRNANTSSIRLYAYKLPDTIELSVGRGSSFLFEDASTRPGLAAELCEMGQAVMRGRFREIVREDDQGLVANEGEVELDGRRARTAHVFASRSRVAASRLIEHVYDPY